MSFGYDRQPRVMLNDSAVLKATLYSTDDTTLIPAADILSVTFTIVRPDGDPNTPDIDHADGTVVGDGEGQYIVGSATNYSEGEYVGIATFTYDDAANSLSGLTKSVPVSYSVFDPFVRVGHSPADTAVRQAWMKIEDCFDSEQGGPWLRDMTLNVFDQSKVRGLLPETLLDINGQMPYSDYTEDSFPYTLHDGQALMAQGLLVSTIRHLMRAYTEQPDVTSSPVAFMDRKKYQQSWKFQYDVEKAVWDKWLNRWKLRTYDLTHASLLLGSKAGRMLPTPMRSRNAGRGF